jgi:hypothetical protein
MSGNTLTISATLQCPHGGTVQIVPGSPRIKVDGISAALATDAFTISGCPFQLPGPIPSPCVIVQWLVTDLRVKAGGAATLSQSSVGICLSAAHVPQGPVVIVNTQVRVKSQ